jgi:monovalent cation:H+ antiporter-2, CPA2 family
MEHGVENPYREHLDTSIRLGIDALRMLGRRAHSATRAGQAFRRYDEEAMRHLVQHRRNKDTYVASVRAAIEEQERLLKADLDFDHTVTDHAWDATPLRAVVQTAKPS